MDNLPRLTKAWQPRSTDGLERLQSSTPARIGVWRTGTRPTTNQMLKFRCDHASAVDAVYSTVSEQLLLELGLFTVETQYENKEIYLKRPDKGRRLTDEAIVSITKKCVHSPQVQIVVSDGLSGSAIEENLTDCYLSLLDSLAVHGLDAGTPFFVKGGRVACMDLIGELLQADVLVLFIGERPGLITSSSMSAYMCYRPRIGTVESDRMVVSNIHPQGTLPAEAGAYIGELLRSMLEHQASGVKLDNRRHDRLSSSAD